MPMAESGLNWLEYIVGSSTGKYLEYLSYLFYDSSDRADAGPLFWLFCPALRTLEKLGNISKLAFNDNIMSLDLSVSFQLVE